ncbi:CBO0543 family protein [Paenibacillus sp. GCM10023248]|uniref:CBO0543 family protein n=1 Tax=unclassified Paenibacillus TaxID=185978 RepID=UPI002379D3D0|nr:CBO0543 family protein [Paenibacillus sp. MAHUQ-63]MDD9270981.1 hypothetical protein [Paenibacillus sp. MAHUQ-63]
MTVERVVLIAVWAVCLLLIPLMIPRHRIREAVLLFLFTQMITWVMSLLFVEWRFIENPIREFPAATQSNFTNNYLLLPLLSTLFSIYYPAQKPASVRFLYHLRIVLAIGVYLAFVSSYTEILNYVHFNIYAHILVVWLVINAVRSYASYFFKKEIRKEGQPAGYE